MTNLETLIRETNAPPDACVIWLHGLGADGYDFYEIVPMLRLDKSLAIRFVFPHAPVRPVTINGGLAMRAWYDIYGIGEQYSEDGQGIRDAAALVTRLIEQQIQQGINSKRIILAGFSQGGAISLFCGCQLTKPLAGILGLSTYLPLADQVISANLSANQQTPLLMMHGSEDQTVAFSFGVKSKERLLALGYQLEWHEYPMAHTVSPDQCVDIGSWINKILSE